MSSGPQTMRKTLDNVLGRLQEVEGELAAARTHLHPVRVLEELCEAFEEETGRDLAAFRKWMRAQKTPQRTIPIDQRMPMIRREGE